MNSKQWLGILIFFCLCQGAVTGAEDKIRSDVFKADSPAFNDIEIPLLKNNKLSELIGDDRFSADLYMGQFGVYDDNVNLSKNKREGGGAWANVIGGSFLFKQPDFFEISLKPQFVYIPCGNKQLQNFYTNIDLAANLKINDIISTGISLGYNYLKEYDGNTSRTSRYIGGYVDIKPVERLGIKIDTKLYDLRNRVEGIDWDNFDAVTVSAMPYWQFETGRMALKYTHGYKKFEQSSRGRVNWDEIVVMGSKELTDRITANATVGFQSRRFDQGDDDFNSVVGSLGIDYKPTEKIIISLSGSRRPFDSSSYSNFEVSDSLLFDSETDADFGVARNQMLTSNFGVSNQLGLGIVYTPIVPLKLGAKISGSHIEESPSYNIMRTSVSAVYNINAYTSLGASYIFRLQDGDTGYNDNLVTIGISFTF